MIVRLAIFLMGLAILQLYVNIRLTGDILDWVPDSRRRKALLCLVWVLPAAGAIYVYRRLELNWFAPAKELDEAQSAYPAALMGIDAIFNPSSGNIAETLGKAEITIKAEGEMYDRKLPDFIDLDVKQAGVKDVDRDA